MRKSSDYFGIDKIRLAAKWFDWQGETFNQYFSAEELIKIWEYSVDHPELNDFADTWDLKDLIAACPNNKWLQEQCEEKMTDNE